MSTFFKILVSISLIIVFMAIGSFISAKKGNQTITFVLLVILIGIMRYIWKKQ